MRPRGAAAASVGAFLLYNFLFVEPRYTITVARPEELVNLFLLLFVGLVVGQLAARQRARAEDAIARERESLGPVEEMDTHAIIARNPTVVLIDELAHTNVPGFGAREVLAGRRRPSGRGNPRRQHDERPAPGEHRRRRRHDHGRPGQRRLPDEVLLGAEIVVLDRDLPVINGDILCRMIVAGNPRAMILMLTASGSPDDRVSGLELGADDYLAKPFHFPELVLRIRALARRKPEVRKARLRHADIEADPVIRRATRSGRRLDLSVKEFADLEALLNAAPGFLSAEALLEQVWDEQAYRSPTPLR